MEGVHVRGKPAFDLTHMHGCPAADPDFDKALLCTFRFEKPQRLKVAVHSRSKLTGAPSAKDAMLGEDHLLAKLFGTLAAPISPGQIAINARAWTRTH